MTAQEQYEPGVCESLESLADCRAALDRIDSGLLDLLLERADVVLRVGEIKKASDMAIRDSSREMQILSVVASKAEGSTLSPMHAVNIFSGILSISRTIQETVVINGAKPVSQEAPRQ